jgi:Protein of unknown function (DUF2384)
MSALEFASRPAARVDFAAQMHPALYAQDDGGPPSDQAFVALRAAYRASGGVARGDDLARTFWDHQRGDYVCLARLIVARRIFSFRWNDSYWIPMFQFERGEPSVKPGLGQVLGELADVFDGWSLAAWFAQPSSWLGGLRPVDLMDSDLPLVRNAARADRFIANG